jgi:hypothetical protein
LFGFLKNSHQRYKGFVNKPLLGFLCFSLVFFVVSSQFVRKKPSFCEQHPNNTRTTPEEMLKNGQITGQYQSKPVKTGQNTSKHVNIWQ